MLYQFADFLGKILLIALNNKFDGLFYFFYSFKKEEDLGSSIINTLLLQLGQRMDIAHDSSS